jgi:hypothetical protein
MRRREIIALLCGAGASLAGSFVARGQAPDRMRRIAVLMDRAVDDPEAQARLALFLRGLREAGWVVGRNFSIEYRWGAADAERSRGHAGALAALEPEGHPGFGQPRRDGLAAGESCRAVPIVFVSVGLA